MTIPRTAIVAGLLSLVVLGAWFATGRDVYTKFEVVEKHVDALDPDDPLAGTGFYESDVVERISHREEFRLGLLPTPQRLLDKHLLSVFTLLGVIWAPSLLLLWRTRRRRPCVVAVAKMSNVS